ncbi:MAG: hypothetical protein HWD58_10610 [Bacteroidota bacterium]|nr:MAG: hypothetical protein HWD58_10610 [Bacteroidota bacterium]
MPIRFWQCNASWSHPGTNIANLNINADVNALPQGIHQLYIRSKDANGNWSVTNRSFFYKTGNTTSDHFRISPNWNISLIRIRVLAMQRKQVLHPEPILLT